MPIEDQIGIVRTDVGSIEFKSCWEAIFDTGISRVFLGVHWGFDAFAAKDIRASTNPNGVPTYKDALDIRYTTTGPRYDRPGQHVIGGVPLGIGIANDIFKSNLKPTPASLQPPYTTATGEPTVTVTVPKSKLAAVQRVLAGRSVANGAAVNGVVSNGHT